MENVVAYKIGIDVGLGGVGMAAIAVDESGAPIKILNSQVVTHDSGVDPESQKTGVSRTAVAGVARRTRRLIRRRRKRLQQLDRVLEGLGYPTQGFPNLEDPYHPWRVRAHLASKPVLNQADRSAMISVGVRHLARHRGWRNPYSAVSQLHFPAEESQQLRELRERVAKILGRPDLDPGLTPAELVALHALHPTVKLRGAEGSLGGKLMQSDNANELRKIAEVQGIEKSELHDLIEAVFKAESPRGSAAKRAGRDPLPGMGAHLRAPKAHSAFQRFRILTVLANMRIKQSVGGAPRRLNANERKLALDYLAIQKTTAEPSWDDVADYLGLKRTDLIGSAAVGPDGERASGRSPIDETDKRIRQSKLKSLIRWWEAASRSSRDAMVEQLSFGGSATDATSAGAEAEAYLLEMSETELAKLDSIRLPAGRAAYSVESLEKLTARMLESEDDLFDARMHVFQVSSDWTPPAEPIAAPVGNPAVDRVAKIVARWILAVENVWGAPQVVNIEHVREGLSSDVTARAMDRENNKRYEMNQKVLREMQEKLGIKSKPTKSDLWRYQAISRQNSQCAYCGESVDYFSAEMDHVVPRAGAGSTNTRENLLAVCPRCNKAKSNRLFYEWATHSSIPGVSVDEAIERTKHWLVLPGQSNQQHRKYLAAVRSRLNRQAEDPEIDDRSMESVAWMANELRHRIQQHFRSAGASTSVAVYRGQVTAEARKASGLQGRVALIGGPGKTRLDRRHHAMDAVTIALMEPGISKTLAERINLRDAQHFTRTYQTWKSYQGASVGAKESFARWLHNMDLLTELFNQCLYEDSVPVVRPLRLRLENGAAHHDTVRRLDKRPLSSQFSAEDIDRASSPALWCALTRQPDYDAVAGVPVNTKREIRVHGSKLGPGDTIDLFKTGAAAIAVRGGYAEIGSTIHHARIYRVPGKRRSSVHMMRVFGVDLLAHRREDLFSVVLPPQSISMRQAPGALRQALESGEAEYLGWLVVGDELRLDMGSFNSGQIGAFLQLYPDTRRWRVDGFESAVRLRLRPCILAAEGLAEDAPQEVRKTLDRPGWLVSVSKLWETASPIVLRRDALGRPRISSEAHLPTSWRIEAQK